MATDPNLIKSADLERVRSIDFVSRFTDGIRVLTETLGITRKIEKVPGQVINTYRVTGELESGAVAEGEDIPLSKYETEVAEAFTLTLNKWRKQTTIEAINDKGFDQAVSDTDDAMVRDIQKTIRTQFFNFMATGEGVASGGGLQSALAHTWGQLKVLWEDYDIPDNGYIYMVNPLDAADYLADADVTVQTAFGMTYIEQFLGLYDVLVYSDVPQGTVYATAKNNIILYYTNPRNSDVSQMFDFETDATGLVGVHHDTNYTNLTSQTVAICGIALYAEFIDKVVIATIGGVPAESVTLSQKTMTLAPEATKQLTATVVPAEAGDPVWASSDPTKASVDQTGLVKGVAAGTANITATAGGKTSEACVVTVSGD